MAADFLPCVVFAKIYPTPEDGFVYRPALKFSRGSLTAHVG